MQYCNKIKQDFYILFHAINMHAMHSSHWKNNSIYETKQKKLCETSLSGGWGGNFYFLFSFSNTTIPEFLVLCWLPVFSGRGDWA